ncbi:MAG: SH3 domain-containing protein [Anaerolineae bacterium]|nr:SH3 domain-containing protein [Anaerolineae bacterium]
MMAYRTLTAALLVLAVLLPVAVPAAAQDNTNAWTYYEVNMRTGPAPSFDVVTTLAANTDLILQGRNADTSWVLGVTADQSFRGWVSSQYLNYEPGFSPTWLPVADDVLAAAPPPAAPVPAGAPVGTGAVTAVANYDLNVRFGPDVAHDAVGVMPGGTPIILEGRNGDASWVLGHAADGSLRGWLASPYLQFTTGTAASLPVSGEIINAAAPADTQPDAPPADFVPGADAPDEENTEYLNDPNANPAAVEPYLSANVPGNVLASAATIHQRGLELGVKPNAFIVIGDSTSAGNAYTLPMFVAFGRGTYTLGNYGYLQNTISFFRQTGSFGALYMTSHPGYTTSSILDTSLAHPSVCEHGENPLMCEIRVKQPSVAIIYIGLGDLVFGTPGQYRYNLDIIVNTLLDSGVIPVLNTVTMSEKVIAESGYGPNLNEMNNIVRGIAGAYQVPLIDIQAAAHGLPNQGCLDEGTHLSFREDGVINFNGDEKIYGKDLRELLTLKVLDDLRRNVLN